MKILLIAAVATAALATAAFAADVKTSVQASAASGAATNDTGVTGMKPATASSENVHTAAPQVSGSMLSAWKTSADSYGYSGSANGCHFSGEGGPKGVHSNDNC